jgi:hypothetical protein
MGDYDIHLGELHGYRAFEVDGDRLLSIGYGDYEWRPGTNRARCDRVGQRSRTVWINNPDDPTGIVKAKEAELSHGRIPSFNCDCGFYVIKTERQVREMFEPQGMFAAHNHVVGRVKFWGRAIEHDHGYRVEFARILSIITDEPERFAPVLDRYGIPAIAPTPSMDAWVSDADGSSIKLRDYKTFGIIDWFEVAPGLEVPKPGCGVTVEYENSLITAIHVHVDEEDDE